MPSPGCDGCKDTCGESANCGDDCKCGDNCTCGTSSEENAGSCDSCPSKKKQEESTE